MVIALIKVVLNTYFLTNHDQTAWKYLYLF